MFMIQLSATPTADEVRRVMSVVGLIAGGEVMQQVSSAIQRDFAAPPVTSAMTSPAPADAFVQQPVPPAPGAPVPPAPEAAPRDSAGFPWNEQIHSSAKSFNKSDGTWKKKRGVQDATVTAVEAQLRLAYPAPGPQGAFTAPAPIPPAPVPVPPAPIAAVPPPPVPAAPAPAGTLDFIGLMGKITGHIAAGKITQQDVATVCQQFGVASAPLLGQRPDLVPSVGAALDALALTR